eukprot:CAMPEP_0181326224 /NCGR_PEP_ID=MMETSP1101-20121128/21369_1 /TAXON_ID=46948 /ORGANISM="Rhodomonas abbreviata, Strain Caron Lab Isolate" /LENGTH=583 /DNA_ID=CAMNT_0023434633 /DNA_START=157 /DNA_END=1904 /DNA_ORIENTATION=-
MPMQPVGESKIGHHIWTLSGDEIEPSTYESTVNAQNLHSSETQEVVDEFVTKRSSWSLRSFCCCFPGEEYFDRHPRRSVIFSTLVYTIPVGAAVLVLQATEATIASKGHLLLAAFSAIRDASTSVASIFSFFWFAEMASTGKLFGEQNWRAIGGHMVVSTVCAFALGIVGMIALILCAEPLLDFVSPPKDTESIKETALLAQRVIAASVPFNVHIFAAAGLFLGCKQIAKTVGLFFLWGCASAVGIIVALLKLDCRDEEFQFCPEGVRIDKGMQEVLDCVLTYEKDGWVCSSYQRFMVSGAAMLSIGSAGLSLSLIFCHWQLMKPHGFDFRSSVRETNFLRDWTRDTLWVALRSVSGNSRHLISLAVALRMGITQGAVWIMFGSVSLLAYGIPSNVSCVAMITISRLIGRGELEAAERIRRDYRMFGLLCGIVFCAIAAVSRRGVIESYSKEAEEEAFRGMVDPVWPWVIAYQPLRALQAVYQALVAGEQAFSYWGKATFLSFAAVFVPVVLRANYTRNIETLIIGEVLFTGVLTVLLYIKVHHLVPNRLPLPCCPVAANSPGTCKEGGGHPANEASAGEGEG